MLSTLKSNDQHTACEGGGKFQYETPLPYSKNELIQVGLYAHRRHLVILRSDDPLYSTQN